MSDLPDEPTLPAAPTSPTPASSAPAPEPTPAPAAAPPRTDAGFGEQLSRLFAVSALLLRRASAPAAGAAVLLGIAALTLLGIASVVLMFVVPNGPGPAAELTAYFVFGTFTAILLALPLAGPLAAFTLARTSEDVGFGAVLRLALRKFPAVLFLVFLGTSVPFVLALQSMATGLSAMNGGDPSESLALQFALVISWLALPLYVALFGLLGVAEVVAGTAPPVRSLANAWRLGRGHRILCFLALAGSAIPVVAGSSTGFAMAHSAAAASGLAPLLAFLATLYALGLLAVATHAVASGETGESG